VAGSVSIGRPFSQQAVADPVLFETAPLLSDVVVPAFCDVCERAPGDKAPVCVPPLGLSDGGFVSDNGDWALTDAVGGAVAACPSS
jgi:hypothetical protein